MFQELNGDFVSRSPSRASSAEYRPGIGIDRAELDLFGTQRQQPWSNSAGKRAFDIAIAGPALLLSLPLFAAVAVLIKLESRGAVLFRQRRMGKAQVPFTIYKFRTMVADETPGPLVTRKGDRRMTRVGKFLRWSKLDELPQLYNVLRGDMSFVGPRPKVLGHDRAELLCKPGITGAATLIFAREEDLLEHVPVQQVEDFTVNVLHPIKADLDREYQLSSTLRTDLKIMVNTAFRLRRPEPVRTLDELIQKYSISVDAYLQDS